MQRALHGSHSGMPRQQLGQASGANRTLRSHPWAPIVHATNSPSSAGSSNGKPQDASRKVPDSIQFSAPAPAAKPEPMSLAFESEKASVSKGDGSPVKTTGLHRAPLSGGVKTATNRFDLPSPPVAVRNLVEHARFGHLCTMMSGMHHRRAGYPFGTLVDFATDGAGHPVFCLSPLAIHARNLIEEPRASLVVQMPGWTGLANARVTIFGDVFQLPPELQPVARDVFLQKHSNERKERWVSGNFVYFRMNRIVDIYFVGGFGTVQWLDPAEYLSASPDEILLANPNHILQALNEMYASDLRDVLSAQSTSAPAGGGIAHAPEQTAKRTPVDEVTFISIDATGVDIRVRHGSEFTVERIGFSKKVYNLADAIAAMKSVLQELNKHTL